MAVRRDLLGNIDKQEFENHLKAQMRNESYMEIIMYTPDTNIQISSITSDDKLNICDISTVSNIDKFHKCHIKCKKQAKGKMYRIIPLTAQKPAKLNIIVFRDTFMFDKITLKTEEHSIDVILAYFQNCII